MRKSDPIEQLSISRQSGSGTSMASIAPEGGMLLSLNLSGHELISPNGIADPRSIFMGSVLAPWPNRLRDGHYELDGKRYSFPNLDSQQNLNHGLVAQAVFEVEHHDESSLALSHKFGADPGYPFQVLLKVRYLISEDELNVSATAENNGDDRAPFAIGFHPYFLAGEEFELSGDFTTEVVTDDRMLPVANKAVSGLNYSGGALDHCFFGANLVTLRTASSQLEIELGENMNYFMFYRPDAGPSLLAIEPMSSMANVFADDIESVIIDPGQKKRFEFSVRTR